MWRKRTDLIVVDANGSQTPSDPAASLGPPVDAALDESPAGDAPTATSDTPTSAATDEAPSDSTNLADEVPDFTDELGAGILDMKYDDYLGQKRQFFLVARRSAKGLIRKNWKLTADLSDSERASAALFRRYRDEGRI